MTSTLPTLPTTRKAGCPFDPPPELGEIRDKQPLQRMQYPDGHIGWLATGYAVVRTILADPRFSSRYELMHLPFPGATMMLPPAPPGDLSGIDAPGHTRYRQLLAGKFTARRMRELSGRVAHFTEERLDVMERLGPPLDLVTAFARPVPALMICELLGVPYGDREHFQQDIAKLTSLDVPMDEQAAAWGSIQDYLNELVTTKRANPTDDLLSDLTTSDLSEEELAGLGSFLLGAGLDTTANMLGLGAFCLLQHPGHIEALIESPEQAVEELLRYLTIAPTGVKAALEDVELEGQVIKAGETVTVSMAAANRDPDRFPEPDSLDFGRPATGHLAFSHGAHQCLGQQLARVEMQVAFPALFQKFPTIRLGCELEEVPLRTNMTIYGVHALPVTW